MTWNPRLSLLGAVLALSGCQPLFGIERVSLSTEKPCQGSEEWASAVRVGNVNAGSGQIDLCVRPEGESSYQSSPLLDRFGSDCPEVGYKQLTVPLALEPGSYDLKVISGDEECGDSGLPTTSLTLEEGDVYSVLLLGAEGEGDSELHAYRDRGISVKETKVRFVHAMPERGPLDVGIVRDDDVFELLFTDVEYGASGEEWSESVLLFDGEYLRYPAKFVGEVGVAPAGSNQVEQRLPVSFPNEAAHTLFAIGAADAEDFPPELWTCADAPIDPDSAQPIFSSCGDPRIVAVDVFDTSLSDQFRSHIDERRQPVIDAIGEMDSDLVCLTGLYYPDDVEAARAAAEGAGKHVVASLDFFRDGTIDTSNLRNRDDEFPDFTTPACSGSEDVLDQVLRCLVDGTEEYPGCTMAEGGDQVMELSGDDLTECWSDACGAQVYGLIRTAPGCFSCMLSAVASDAGVDETTQRCTEGSTLEERLAFGGTLGLVVLSSFRVQDSQAYMMPSSSWAHGVLRVVVDVGNGEDVDFYCGSTGVADDLVTNPYGGEYGEGQEGWQGKLNEQRLVVERMLDLVNAQSGAPGSRAILAGALYSGLEYMDHEGTLLVDEWRPEVYELIAAELDPLVAPDFVPGCTACPSNAAGPNFTYGDETVGYWVTHLFGRGFLPHDAISTELTHEDSVVPVGDDAIPLSQLYGLRSVLRVAQ